MTTVKKEGGRPKSERPKTHIGFRWDPDSVASIQATGKNCNTRIEHIIREAQRTGKL